MTKAPPAVDNNTSESDSDEQQIAKKEHNVNQKTPNVPHPPSTPPQSPPTRGAGYHFRNRSLVSPVPSPTAVQPSRPFSDLSTTSISDTVWTNSSEDFTSKVPLSTDSKQTSNFAQLKKGAILEAIMASSDSIKPRQIFKLLSQSGEISGR